MRENQLTIRAYFEMLDLELQHRDINKAASNRTLLAQLDGRTRSAVERKHQNISAVLRDLGGPSIDGYKPLGNYQGSLASMVLEYLERHPEHVRIANRVAEMSPPASYELPLHDPSRLVKRPSPLVREEPRRTFTPSHRPSKYDYATRDADNRRLGELGEKYVLDFERAKLQRLGRDDLASKVEWSSKERGDGLGYDIGSFDEHGKSLLIEVKTTNLPKSTPFIISPNEVATSERESPSYRLYRLFRFSLDPHFYELLGSVRDSCELVPRSFLARVSA